MNLLALLGSQVLQFQARCIQEILGIKISLIYHLLDQQQVNDLSHIGLLSSGMTFHIESFDVFKNAIKGRALDEFLSH